MLVEFWSEYQKRRDQLEGEGIVGRIALERY
jgi:hypothetical protein